MSFNWVLTIFSIFDKSFDSLPKAKVSIWSWFKIARAPLAKISADCVAKAKGNSTIMSILFSRLILVLSHLFKIETSPLSVKQELVIRIIIDSGNCSLTLFIFDGLKK